MDKKKVLIVDDNEDLSKALSILLRARSYATVAAADAISAISKARNERPDLILLDLGLPAVDGYAVMERLNDVDVLASIPVIVLTARDQDRNRVRSLKAGARDFFQKPVDSDALLASIERALEESGAGKVEARANGAVLTTQGHEAERLQPGKISGRNPKSFEWFSKLAKKGETA